MGFGIDIDVYGIFFFVGEGCYWLLIVYGEVGLGYGVIYLDDFSYF